MKKNVASQLVCAQMISATDGSNVTTGTCSVAVEIDGAAGTGGTATHVANGKWEYAPSQADTNGDHLTFQFVLSGAITQTVQIYTEPAVRLAAGAITESVLAADAINASKIADGALTAAKIASDAITAAKLAADAVVKVATGVWDRDLTAHLIANSGGVIVRDIQTSANSLLTRLGVPSDLGGGATVAANLVDIEGQTDDIGASGAGLSAVPWNAAWAAQVQAAAEAALIAHHLDHLIGAAAAGTEVANNSLLARLVSKSATPAFSSFNNQTDSLEAARDSQVAATDIVSGGPITTSGGAVSTVTSTSAVAGNVGGNVNGTVAGVAGATQTLDALYTLLAALHATTLAAVNTKPAASDIVNGGPIDTSSGAVSSVTTVGSVTDQVSADVTAINGSTTAAVRQALLALIGVPGTVNDASATTTEFQSAGITESIPNQLVDGVIVFTSGNLINLRTNITASDGAGLLTVTAMPAAPTNGSSFVLI